MIYGQDTEPSAWKFIDTSSFNILTPTPQTSVLTGFQWSGSLKMNNALLNEPLG